MNTTIEPGVATETSGENITRYVVGFLFSKDFRLVALIRKMKPAWQAGLLNGIGGKIEAGESTLDAMIREFHEEANYGHTEMPRWKPMCHQHGRNNDGSEFECYFFFATGALGLVSSREQEQIEIHDTHRVAGGWEATIGNLPWLVALARDFGLGKYPPTRVTVVYGE
jgi:8-oxo-dGTP diphosphatase